MRDETFFGFLGFVLGVVITAMIVGFIMENLKLAHAAQIKAYNAEALERGYKFYDAKTGELKWKD